MTTCRFCHEPLDDDRQCCAECAAAIRSVANDVLAGYFTVVHYAVERQLDVLDARRRAGD